jgi:hypothetical protein
VASAGKEEGQVTCREIMKYQSTHTLCRKSKSYARHTPMAVIPISLLKVAETAHTILSGRASLINPLLTFLARAAVKGNYELHNHF